MTLTRKTKTILGAVALIVFALAVLPLFSNCRGSGKFDMPLRIRQGGIPIPPTEVATVGYVFVATPDIAEGILASMAAEPNVPWCSGEAAYRDGEYIIRVPVSWIGPAIGPLSWHRRSQAPYVLVDVCLRDGRVLRAFLRTTEPTTESKMAPPLILDLGPKPTTGDKQ